VAEDATAPAPQGVELTVPDLGPSVGVATIVAWSKQVGDRVTADEPICRLAVDQLQFEVHSTADGELRRVFAAAGESVHSGDSLAEIGAPATELNPPPPTIEAAQSISQPEPPAVEIETEPPFYVTEPPVVEHQPELELDPRPEPEPPLRPEPGPEPISQPDPDAWPRPSGDVDWSRWHSPVVRMLAEQHDVDLSRVQGTGIGGRIRKRDVLAHVQDAGS